MNHSEHDDAHGTDVSWWRLARATARERAEAGSFDGDDGELEAETAAPPTKAPPGQRPREVHPADRTARRRHANPPRQKPGDPS